MKKALKLGQVILTTEAPVGNVAQIKEKKHYILSQRVIAFETDKNLLDDFLYFLLQRNNSTLLRYSTGGTAKGISQKSLKQVKINLTPNISEQKQISQLLNVVKNLITLYDRKLKLLSQMKKYFLDNLFTEKEYPNLRLNGFTDAWEQRKLNDIAKVYDGIHETPNYTTYGIPFASVENIRTLATKKYVSKNFYEEKFKIKPQYNDILMTRIGDIGTSNVVSKVPLAYYVSLALIRLNADQNAHFFKYYFDSEYAQKELWSRTLHIAFPKKINKNEIGKINVYTTSIKEENKISQLFNKLNYLLTLYENKQQHLNEIKKTLLNTMFI